MKLHTEEMKLIAITTPTFFVEEDQIITALFEEGLDILHLRKPETAPMYSERLLTLIPAKYHKRIVVHDHFYLQEEFGLMGVHLSERNPNEPHDFSGHLTTSCTSLEELRSKKRYYDYTILYPVFDGISPSAMPVDTMAAWMQPRFPVSGRAAPRAISPMPASSIQPSRRISSSAGT